MKKNTKERLFEVMSRVDKTFKIKLNEELDLSKYNIEVNQPDYKGTIRRLGNGKWLLYDIKNNPEEAGPFDTVNSLMDYYDISKDQLIGDYIKNINEWGDENDPDYENDHRNFEPTNNDNADIEPKEKLKTTYVSDYFKQKKETNEVNNPNDELLEFTIPSWAISTLINGDNSGNSDEDDQKINAFVQDTVEEYGNANFMLGDMEGKDDLGFCRTNDIDNLGSDCYRLYLKPSK